MNKLKLGGDRTEKGIVTETRSAEKPGNGSTWRKEQSQLVLKENLGKEPREKLVSNMEV